MEEDPEILFKTKWLQNRIWERGLEGAHYMEIAEQQLKYEGEHIVQRRVDAELPSEI